MGFISGLQKGYKEFEEQFERASESVGRTVGCSLPWLIVAVVVLVVFSLLASFCSSVVSTADLEEQVESNATTSVADCKARQGNSMLDSTPWVRNSQILSSFPPDVPPPTFIGGFGGNGANSTTYELKLWSDRQRVVFGELLRPVLEADSPTSRLYDPGFDRASGELRFGAKFGRHALVFRGILKGDRVTGNVTIDGRNEQGLILRRLRLDQLHGGNPSYYKSRAHFECAMDLFNR